MSTPLDLIKRALRLLGVLAQGETPAASDADDGLRALNAMVELWDNEKLMLYTLTNNLFTLTSGVSSYTLGPVSSGATWECTNITRPLIVDKVSAFIRQGSTDTNIEYYSNSRYNDIAGKSDPGFPDKWTCDWNYPIATVRVYPTPSESGLYFGLTESKSLTRFNNLTDSIVLPNGYEQALTYNLAVELAPEYSVEPQGVVLNTAANSKFLLKRVNSSDVLLDCDNSLLRSGYYNIDSDSYVK